MSSNPPASDNKSFAAFTLLSPIAPNCFSISNCLALIFVISFSAALAILESLDDFSFKSKSPDVIETILLKILTLSFKLPLIFSSWFRFASKTLA